MFGKHLDILKPIILDIEECIGTMDVKMIATINDQLEKNYTRTEIEEALQQMAPLKSQDLDGYGACFFQSH